MKKLPIVLGLTVAASMSTQAAIVIQENFTYVNGSINGQNGGTGFASGWTATDTAGSQFEVESNQAIYKGDTVNQVIASHSRAFASSYILDASTTITVTFNSIVNETALGRGVGISLQTHLTLSRSSSASKSMRALALVVSIRE